MSNRVDPRPASRSKACRGPGLRSRHWPNVLILPPALLLVTLLLTGAAHAQSLSLNLGPTGEGQSMTTNVVGLVALTTVLSLAPGILVVATAFTRLVVVLSLLRTAIGLQQSPPNVVIVSLALFLTAFVMAPAFDTAYRAALRPLMDGSITEEQAFDRGIKPFRAFMEANTQDKDLQLFMDLAQWTPPKHEAGDDAATAVPPSAVPAAKEAKPGAVSRTVRADLPLQILCAAFLVSELSKAFQIGFLLFLPFMVIDMAVSSLLMGMGMMMLPPTAISLPFKLIFFVLVDGWELVSGSLVRSFAN
jgi:flagellar biosynthesis protein FliP